VRRAAFLSKEAKKHKGTSEYQRKTLPAPALKGRMENLMMWDKEIDLQDMEGLYLGNAQDHDAETGVTALVFPEGAAAGCRISGGGPASRETGLTYSETAENRIHSIVLAGGSAFGLAASQGVMECLEKHRIGYQTPFAIVPLVCQSCIYDLNYGRSDVRPDPAMGYEACENALQRKPLAMGNSGAGTGATVGKLKTMKNASKSGLGWFAARLGELQMAAIVSVNAMGDVYDPSSGKKLAGMMTDDRKSWIDAEDYMAQLYRASRTKTDAQGAESGAAVQNTTIGAVVTNAAFTKPQMNKIAAMTLNAYARCIRPVATMSDGDTVYAASIGKLQADINLAGSLAAQVMQQAIIRAVTKSRVSDEEYLSKAAL
jgi:L-aminopeptidase/D-esterase-like protein